MGYPKDGRRGFDALKYRNTVPCHEIDHRAVPRGEDPAASEFVAAASG